MLKIIMENREWIARKELSEQLNNNLMFSKTPEIEVDEQEFLRYKYSNIYEQLKRNVEPHQAYTTVEFYNSKQDITRIEISSPSFHCHVYVANPNWNCLADTKREVLKKFREDFKQYLK